MFPLQLQGMIGGVTNILVYTLKGRAVLGKWHKRLGHRWRTCLHLIHPSGIRGGYSIERSLARLENVIQLLSHRKIRGIQSIDGGHIREQPSLPLFAT